MGIFAQMWKNICNTITERNDIMKSSITRRGIVRFASFMLAIIAVLGISNALYMKRISVLENAVEASYGSAVESLAQSADKISAVLTKGRYASSPAMMTRLSNELTEQSAMAKTALQSLPVWGMELDGLEKFLSQVGNYASSLSRRASAGDELKDEDMQNIAALAKCAQQLTDSLWELRYQMAADDLSISQLFENLDGELGKYVSDGFSGINNGFDNMPKLIYDGPFSDHILERTPLMTKNAKEVTKEEALEKASKALGIESYRLLECESSEEGKMPSWCFYCDGQRCAVTKNGGYIVYCLKSRNAMDGDIGCAEAVRRADSYLESLGIKDMERTYYECYNNVCTVNYAYKNGNVICYTDLIKVAVALDNGEVMGYDARGYLVNHQERDFDEPTFTEEDVRKSASKSLDVKSCRLAVIPTDAVEEKLCYELKCTADESNVLLYVNAMTGEEEDILILIENENGSLTI